MNKLKFTLSFPFRKGIFPKKSVRFLLDVVGSFLGLFLVNNNKTRLLYVFISRLVDFILFREWGFLTQQTRDGSRPQCLFDRVQSVCGVYEFFEHSPEPHTYHVFQVRQVFCCRGDFLGGWLCGITQFSFGACGDRIYSVIQRDNGLSDLSIPCAVLAFFALPAHKAFLLA